MEIVVRTGDGEAALAECAWRRCELIAGCAECAGSFSAVEVPGVEAAAVALLGQYAEGSSDSEWRDRFFRANEAGLPALLRAALFLEYGELVDDLSAHVRGLIK